ncbi:MAG: hypothetical protein JNM00_02960 [Flavobacteriales bacterium]|nr:hypothetical protein [Flavobacteriales bacterium]
MVFFKDIIGQEEAKARLRRSFNESKLAHALLFYGPEGNGSFALALAFCRYIACSNRSADDACGECPTCRKFSSLQFADLHFSFPFFNKGSQEKTVCDDYAREWREWLLREGPYGDLDSWRKMLDADRKQLHMSVHEAGSIVQHLSLKAYEGGYKFQLIWHAEHMRNDTANKLLKIVEEPPEKTLFIFLTQSAESMLPTVLSRVQMLHIPAIEDAAMVNALVANGIAAEKAEGIAHYSAGNWKLAQQLAAAEDPHAFLFQQFQSWMRFCYKRDVGPLVKWCDGIATLTREDQRSFISYALEQIRQNVVLNYTEGKLGRQNESEKDFSVKFARYINHTNIEEFYEEMNRAHEDIGRNVNSKLVFLDLSFKVHHMLTRKVEV